MAFLPPGREHKDRGIATGLPQPAGAATRAGGIGTGNPFQSVQGTEMRPRGIATSGLTPGETPEQVPRGIATSGYARTTGVEVSPRGIATGNTFADRQATGGEVKLRGVATAVRATDGDAVAALYPSGRTRDERVEREQTRQADQADFLLKKFEGDRSPRKAGISTAAGVPPSTVFAPARLDPPPKFRMHAVPDEAALRTLMPPPPTSPRAIDGGAGSAAPGGGSAALVERMLASPNGPVVHPSADLPPVSRRQFFEQKASSVPLGAASFGHASTSPQRPVGLRVLSPRGVPGGTTGGSPGLAPREGAGPTSPLPALADTARIDNVGMLSNPAGKKFGIRVSDVPQPPPAAAAAAAAADPWPHRSPRSPYDRNTRFNPLTGQ